MHPLDNANMCYLTPSNCSANVVKNMDMDVTAGWESWWQVQLICYVRSTEYVWDTGGESYSSIINNQAG